MEQKPSSSGPDDCRYYTGYEDSLIPVKTHRTDLRDEVTYGEHGPGSVMIRTTNERAPEAWKIHTNVVTDQQIDAAVEKAAIKHYKERQWDVENQKYVEAQHVSESGVVRSDPTGKTDYTLISYEMLERWAVHMTGKVALKGHNNWRNAGPEDADRFIQGAWRHWIAWLNGEQDEDHAAALLFNVAGYEHARGTR